MEVIYFAPAQYGTSIHGGWKLTVDQKARKKNFITSLAVTGFAAVMVIFGIVKLKKKSW